MLFAGGIAAAGQNSLFQRLHQTAVVTIAATASTGTATITDTTDLAYTTAFYGGFNSTDTARVDQEDWPVVEVTNGTTITAKTHAANASFSRVVHAHICTWARFAIKSIQHGEITIGSGVSSAAATIAAVDMSRSVVLHRGQRKTVATGNNDWNYNVARLDLQNTTTVRARKNSSSNPDLIVAYTVIEFAEGIVDSVQHYEGSIAGSSATGDVTISAVEDGRSFLFNGGWNMGAFTANALERQVYQSRTSTTNIRGTRGSSGTSTTGQFNGCIAQFKSKWITRRQAGVTTIASGASSGTTSISEFTPGKALRIWCGHTAGGNNGGLEGGFAVLTTPSTTSVGAVRGGTPSFALSQSFELMETY